MRSLTVASTIVVGLVLAIVAGARLTISPAPVTPRPVAEAPGADAADQAPLAPEVRLGLPDCPPRAMADMRGSDALECWFGDETFGPWHIVSSLEIQGITIVRLVATDPGVAETVARRLVEQGGTAAEEVLVYAKPLRGPGVTRVRWTPAGGFETSTFVVN